MKRTPLKRKTPLKRGVSQLKRTPLKPVSDDRAKWNRKFVRAKDKLFQNGQRVICALTGEYMDRNRAQFHHPFGRMTSAILAFVPVTPPAHQNMEDQGEQSRSLGWIQPERTGRKCFGERKFPWDKSLEATWPDEWQRENVLARDLSSV